MAENTQPFKRYSKVLGTNVERILRVRRQRPKLRSKIEIVSLPEEDLTAPIIKLAKQTEQTSPLHKRVEIVRPTAHTAEARRIITRSMGILMSYFDDRIEVTIPNPESAAHAVKLAESLESLPHSQSAHAHWAIDLRALRSLHPPIVNALYSLNANLLKANKTLSLIVDEQLPITSRAGALAISLRNEAQDFQRSDQYNIKQALL